MLNRHTREIMFYDLVLSVEPEGYGGVQPLSWFMERIARLQQRGATAIWTREKKKKLRVSAMTPWNTSLEVVTLLLHLNDRDGPDADFCNFETDAEREEAKAENEGRPETAHAAILLNPYSENPNRYLFLLEKRAQLNRAKVERYLGRLLRMVKADEPKAFRYPHPDGSLVDGKPRQQIVTPRAELQGLPSPDFVSEILAGKLSSVRLVTRDRRHMATGESSLVKPTTAEIKFSPIHDVWKDPIESIKDVIRIGRETNYERVKIAFKSADQSSHSCELSTESGSIIGEGFVLKKKFSDQGAMFRESERKIHQKLDDAMRQMIFEYIDELYGEKNGDMVSAISPR